VGVGGCWGFGVERDGANGAFSCCLNKLKRGKKQ
jgi:hypothetical protein